MNLSEFEENVVKHIHECSSATKHAARSAIRHLERASQLATSMPELAVFSAITAEEESATAIFHALKRRGYDGAQQLNVRNHRQKTALHPFLLAVEKLFAELESVHEPHLEFNSELSPDGTELLRIRHTVIGPDGNPLWAYTNPPLEFSVSVNNVVHDFGAELAQLATENNAASAIRYVEKLANRRNLALYASPNGIPHMEGSVEPFLGYRKSVVFSHLMVVLLIEPHAQRQSFVQQSLTAFLKLLTKMPTNGEEK